MCGYDGAGKYSHTGVCTHTYAAIKAESLVWYHPPGKKCEMTQGKVSNSLSIGQEIIMLLYDRWQNPQRASKINSYKTQTVAE